MNVDNPAAPAPSPADGPAASAAEPVAPSVAAPAPHLLRAPDPISIAPAAPAAPVISTVAPAREIPDAEPLSAEVPHMSVPSGRSGNFGMLAASVAIAACVGSALGAAGSVGIAKLTSRSAATTPTPYIAKVVESPEEVRALRDAVAQMRGNLKQVSDGLGALRASVEASGKSAAPAQDKKLTETLARLNEGLDKIDRAQAEPVARLVKVIETLDRVERRTAQLAAAEATGSVVPQTRPPQQQQLGSPPQYLQLPATELRPIGQPVIEGWRVRRVTDGVALLEGPDRVIEVEAGEVIRGVGRVNDIKRMDGRWVVVTARGLIR